MRPLIETGTMDSSTGDFCTTAFRTITGTTRRNSEQGRS